MTVNRHANMVDVARAAGVGTATVSRALSGAAGVSPRTRAHVLSIAEGLGYVVSPEASRLARGVTGRVAVIVPHVDRWFFGALLAGIERVLSEARIDLLLYQVTDEEQRHRFFTDLPARRKVDAVLVLGLPVTPGEHAALQRMGVRIVSVGGQIADFPSIRIDDVEAGRQATAHLVTLGHRRIGMIATTDPDIPEWSVSSGRSDGYTAAHQAAGLPLDPELVMRVSWNAEQAGAAAGRLISLRDPPTAIYAHSDEIAAAVLCTLRRAGLDVPRDVSVIGIDDHPIAALMDLTTVAQPVLQQGVAAGAAVLALLAGEPIDDDLTLDTWLVPRGSTAAPRAPNWVPRSPTPPATIEG